MIQQFLRHDFVFKTVKSQEASNKSHQGTKAKPVSMQENTLLEYTAPRSSLRTYSLLF